MPGLHFAFAGRWYVKLYQQGAGERLWGCRRGKRLAGWFASFPGQSGCFRSSAGLHWQIFPALRDPASLCPRRTPDQRYWGDPLEVPEAAAAGDPVPWGSSFGPTSLPPSFCCSVAHSCLTLCDPMDCSTPGFPVLHHLPELAQIHVHRVNDTIQLSRALSPSPPPALSLSQHQGLFP